MTPDGTRKPRLLDLFCGAGGAAYGYHLAGFEVVGVDHLPQKHYPFECWRGDALTVWDWLPYTPDDFDAVHASPPCLAHTVFRNTGMVRDAEDLIPATRELLCATGLPYAIENVEGARGHMVDPLRLCGSMFDEVTDVQRHRLFETNFPVPQPRPCNHAIWEPGRFPGNRKPGQESKTCRRATIDIGHSGVSVEIQRAAIGCPWMIRDELRDAIPPAYTEHVGRFLVRNLGRIAV